MSKVVRYLINAKGNQNAILPDDTCRKFKGITF